MAFTKNDSATANGGGASTATMTLSGAAASGSTIVGCYSWDNSTSVTITSVTDNASNTYNLETKLLDTTDGQNFQCFSLSNINNGPTIITVHLSASVGGQSGLIEAWTGAAAVADARSTGGHGGQYQGSVGTGANAVSSGSFTPADNGCLIWGATGNTQATGATDTAGTGFAIGTHNAGTTGSTASLTTEFQTQGTAASIAATFTQSVTSQRCNSMIAFKPAGGAAFLASANNPILQAVKRAAYW